MVGEVPQPAPQAAEGPQSRVYQLGQEFPAVLGGNDRFTLDGVGEGFALFEEWLDSTAGDMMRGKRPQIATRDASGGFVLRDVPLSFEPEIHYFDPDTVNPHLFCHARLGDLELRAPNDFAEAPDEFIASFFNWKAPDGSTIEFDVFDEDREAVSIRFEQGEAPGVPPSPDAPEALS